MILNPQEGQSPSPTSAVIAAVHRTAVIVVCTLGASVGMFTVIGLVLAARAQQPEGVSQSRLTFIVIAVLLAVASIALRRTQMGRSRLQAVATAGGSDALIRHFLTMTIVASALAEGIGILGLLIGLFGGTQLDVITFGLVGGLILLSNFPRRTAWQKAVEYFALTQGDR